MITLIQSDSVVNIFLHYSTTPIISELYSGWWVHTALELGPNHSQESTAKQPASRRVAVVWHNVLSPRANYGLRKQDKFQSQSTEFEAHYVLSYVLQSFTILGFELWIYLWVQTSDSLLGSSYLWHPATSLQLVNDVSRHSLTLSRSKPNSSSWEQTV